MLIPQKILFRLDFMNIRKLIGAPICALFLKVPSAFFKYLRVSFSVTGEDLVLEAIVKSMKVKNPGFYVDVGANHPFRCSNTWRLKKLYKWRGINIDASSQSIAAFKKYRPEDINISSAVSVNNGELNIVFDKRDPFGSSAFVSEMPMGIGEFKHSELVKTRPLSEILDESLPSGMLIDVLNIDCEGHDLKVLESNNWDKYRPTLILVEDVNNISPTPIEKYCKSIGYYQVAFTGLTRFFAKSESLKPQA